MTIYGDYKVERRRGKDLIHPVLFIATNWPILRRLGGLSEREAGLKVRSGASRDPNEDTVSIYIDPLDGKATVNKTDLQIDVIAAKLGGMNPIGMLWGIPAGMIRALLFRHGKLPKNERITFDICQRVGWPDGLVDSFRKAIKFPPDTDDFNRQVDSLIVQGAVQAYCQNAGPEDELDTGRIERTIKSTRSSIDESLFKLDLN